MFDSKKATARESPCCSESTDGTMASISEPSSPMQNEAPIVTAADQPAMRTKALALMPKAPSHSARRGTQAPYQERTAKTDEQDADGKRREVQAADRIRQRELVFEKGSDGTQAVEKEGVEGQEQVDEPGGPIAMKAL